MPVLEDVPEPSLIHWATFGKPWDPELTYGRDLWQGYATTLRDRAGTPPTADAGATGSPARSTTRSTSARRRVRYRLRSSA